jgi:hypothetical protein
MNDNMQEFVKIYGGFHAITIFAISIIWAVGLYMLYRLIKMSFLIPLIIAKCIGFLSALFQALFNISDIFQSGPSMALNGYFVMVAMSVSADLLFLVGSIMAFNHILKKFREKETSQPAAGEDRLARPGGSSNDKAESKR